MNKRGVTLIELLVYIALFTVVSLFIGTQMKQLLGSYSSGRRISKVQSDTRDILSMMSREIRNTGLKTYLVSSGGGRFNTVSDPGAYIHSDSSSFVHKEGDPGDSLIIYKLTLDDKGDRSSVDTIQYYLDGTVLKRSAGGKVVDIAENIHALQFQYGVLSVDSLLLDQTVMDKGSWDVPFSVEKSGAMTVKITSSTSGSIKYNSVFKISKPQRIKVRFLMTASGGFPSNLDSIKCVIRDQWNSGVIYTSEPFMVNGTEMEFEMPVVATNSATISFDYKCHGSGELNISSVEIRRADIGEYSWKNNPTASLKKAIKAIKIYALVRSNGKTDVISNGTASIANVVVPTTGPYIWRVAKETVEILNNGVF